MDLTDWLETLFHSDWYKIETEGHRTCPICNESYNSHSSLAYHMVDEHSNESTYFNQYFDDLNYMLKNPVEYFTVFTPHGESCSICAKRFISTHELERHINSRHKSEIEKLRKELKERKSDVIKGD